MRLILSTGLMLLASLGAVSNLCAQAVSAPQMVAEGVEIALSGDWRVSSRKQIVQFEAARDQVLAQANLQPSVEPKEVVTWQAETGSSADQAFIGITFIPVGEASQQQVARYSTEQVKNLGSRLIEQHRRALSAARCTGLSFSTPVVAEVGGKKAISFAVEFTTPDGVSRTGTKQHVYMRQATVVLTTAAPAGSPNRLQGQLAAGLASLKLTEN